ncbi:MAG: PEGA domain-containing protein [Deltaproteobacteria bacterium]|nr:PEGA domain-containing protein [Deltaproteobacteria bacterium]
MRRFFLIVMVGLWSPAVLAAGKADLVKAKRLFVEGQKHFLKGEYQKCADTFLEAYRYRPFAAFYYNAAVCLEKSHQYVKAVSYFKEYIHLKPHAEDVPLIHKRIAALAKFISAQTSCSSDAQCGAGYRCVTGKCVALGTCKADSACGAGYKCVSGRCLAAGVCKADSECGAGYKCVTGKCVALGACKADSECGAGYKCVTGKCVVVGTCKADSECGTGYRCQSGKCLVAAPPHRAPVLPPLKTKGLVVIDSQPQGAKIWLKDKMKPPIGLTPYQGTLPAGDYMVLVELKGFKPSRRRIHVTPSRMLDLYFALSRDLYMGWVEVTSNVPGAKVYVDNAKSGAVGRTPYSGFRKPGLHTFWVSKAGYVTRRKDVRVISGKTHRISFRLTRVRYGWVNLGGKATKGAVVKVDGKQRCRAPCKVVKVAAGGHRLTVVRPGYKTLVAPFKVEQGRVTDLAVRLYAKPSRVPAYVAYGFVGAFLAGAIYSAVQAKNLKDDLDSEIKAGKLVVSTDKRFKQGKIYSGVADGLFGLSALVGAMALYYQFRNTGPKSKLTFTIHGVSMTPQVGLGTVALGGTFDF